MNYKLIKVGKFSFGRLLGIAVSMWDQRTESVSPVKSEEVGTEQFMKEQGLRD